MFVVLITAADYPTPDVVSPFYTDEAAKEEADRINGLPLGLTATVAPVNAPRTLWMDTEQGEDAEDPDLL